MDSAIAVKTIKTKGIFKELKHFSNNSGSHIWVYYKLHEILF